VTLLRGEIRTIPYDDMYPTAKSSSILLSSEVGDSPAGTLSTSVNCSVAAGSAAGGGVPSHSRRLRVKLSTSA